MNRFRGGRGRGRLARGTGDSELMILLAQLSRRHVKSAQPKTADTLLRQGEQAQVCAHRSGSRSECFDLIEALCTHRLQTLGAKDGIDHISFRECIVMLISEVKVIIRLGNPHLKVVFHLGAPEQCQVAGAGLCVLVDGEGSLFGNVEASTELDGCSTRCRGLD